MQRYTPDKPVRQDAKMFAAQEKYERRRLRWFRKGNSFRLVLIDRINRFMARRQGDGFRVERPDKFGNTETPW